MTNQSSESTRYMIQVGRNRFRRDTWEAMKDICAVEGTRLADEIWCAMDAHVKEYASSNGVKDSGDGRIHMARDTEFDDVVANETYAAQEDVVEEIF